MNCEKCNHDMVKKGTIESGNAKYIVWRCKYCAKETMQCTGLKNV